MSGMKIEGKEYPIGKVFSDDFVFTIPLYQRPYAWTTEQAGEMLEDLIACLEDASESLEEVNPYFLGSIVLIKGDMPDAQVVDGQQRLTTLTILLAALRAVLPSEHASDLTNFLYQKGSSITGIPNRYRLTLRERDAQFFKQYIQDEEGLPKLLELKSAKLTDSQRNIRENAALFLDRLPEISEQARIRLAQFIVIRCFLVVVSTPDLESAYRIFSVLNDRGLDLSHTDILKAEIIGKIPDDRQEAYGIKWEYIEEKLGREMFQDLFAHIRMIERKTKLRESILKEVRQYVLSADNPQQLIDKTLQPLADAFYDIKNATAPTEEINGLFKFLNRIDNSDWVPPAILYLSRHYNQPEELLCFFSDLERLAAGLFIMRVNLKSRIERYSKLLTAIESGEDLYADESPLQLKPKEQSDILRNIDADSLNPKVLLYVLLRLDAALSGVEFFHDFPTITVEHVLPPEPDPDSIWVTWFPNAEQRNKYVHRLGNLVLISSRRKKIAAQNYDFEAKKQNYFTNEEGVSPFALTGQVLNEEKWTPEVIDRRQQQLIGVFKKLWRL